MPNHQDPLARAQNSAHEWLAAISQALGTQDRRFAYRALRAWLHALRDRLTVEAAAHFAAQLPELLRGTYYDGWVPSRVPVRFSTEECVERFSTHATVRRTDVRNTITGVSTGMAELLSPGTLEHALQQLPQDLRELFTPQQPAVARAGQEERGRHGHNGEHAEHAEMQSQLRDLRRQIDDLTDAVSALSRRA
ncbi:hypothetical protein SacmaDRAFT_2995 [Saccharomonospora marina XMU15]|uniref:DUF2267 domain-containing protein n=1 Tax=Saccharomonospora marina XMU15 TaxID=882083 RepID=H5X6L0_9PSEU|nr:DUF2267 domain-containing protein [Saccharomonospora marina]EHR51231.1 hypothetical protein SacmaDRAFT_2995 [Saccharomonospora marina XMU15]